MVAAAASCCFCQVLTVAVILTCLWVRVGPLFSTRCEPLRPVSVYKHVGTWVSSAASYQRDISHKASVATTGYLQAVKTVFSRRQSRLLSNSGGWSVLALPQLAKLESVRSRVLKKTFLERYRGQETSISDEKIRKEAKVPPVHVLIMARGLQSAARISRGAPPPFLHFYSGTDHRGKSRSWSISATCMKS